MQQAAVSFPVLGFRSWRGDGTGRLRSLVQTYCWETGANRARCLRRFHLHRSPAPASKCDCGLYAWHDLETGFRTYGSRTIVGLVRGWGKVEVHRDGWRAQHAEVLAIVPRDGAEGRHKAQQAAERYKVPLLPATVSPALISDFGRVVPEELRPNTPVVAFNRGRSMAEDLAEMAPLLSGLLLIYVASILWHGRKQRRSA